MSTVCCVHHHSRNGSHSTFIIYHLKHLCQSNAYNCLTKLRRLSSYITQPGFRLSEFRDFCGLRRAGPLYGVNTHHDWGHIRRDRSQHITETWHVHIYCHRFPTDHTEHQRRSLPTDGWVKRMWFIYTMESYVSAIANKLTLPQENGCNWGSS